MCNGFFIPKRFYFFAKSKLFYCFSIENSLKSWFLKKSLCFLKNIVCKSYTQFEKSLYLYQQVSKAANNYKRQKISHMTTTNTTTATSTKSLAFKAAHKSAKNQIARGFKGAYKFFFAQALKDFYKKLKIEKMLSEMPVIAQSVSDVEFSTYLAYVD